MAKRRPPHRDQNFTIPLDEDTLLAAQQRAGSPSKLRAIFRIFFKLWGSGDWPPEMQPSEEEIEGELTRARKRPRKKKSEEE